MAQEIDLTTERWEDFLKRYCWDELVELSNYYPEKRSLLVKFTDMDIYDPNLADMVLESPDVAINAATRACLLYTSPSPRDLSTSRMPSSA